MTYSEASKLVGFQTGATPAWPTGDEVLKAIGDNDIFKLLTWQRYLPSPKSSVEASIISKVVQASGMLRDMEAPNHG